ncbi:alpha/beta hydrolase [Hyunsoonleella sp. SJ7]|uniref:Alpha/beta hydrolase n=1 Tax=Hyunsoonleella aquatilis TaxID=2762758 RepID=A0A923HEZ0_9FLAO|nr:alpha/beta hydrolase [Hyunsoonleella aquatilis]MBC3758175.1 alpha/beta hydrolase [Hyunsoonleella aquatilis]
MTRLATLLTVLIVALLTSCATSKSARQDNGNTLEYALKGNGSPTIVFESGMGQSLDTWNKIFDSLSQHNRVYAYNRPGYSNSTNNKLPNSVQEVAQQLRENLKKENIEPPYILVGHSLGGLFINMYARLYPDEVAGVVFIDASHPEQFEYFKNEQKLLYNMLISSTKMGKRQYEFDIITSALSSFRGAPEFPNIPITVLTAGKKSSPLETQELREKWLEFQSDLVDLSSKSSQIIVEESGHYIHKKTPCLVISEILKLASNQI